MNIVSLLIDGLWAGLLSGAFVVIFSAPPQILPFGAAGGFIARICRDLLMQAVAVRRSRPSPPLRLW